MEHVHIDGHGSTRQLIDNTGTPAGINDSFSYDAYGVMLGGNPVDTSGSTSLLYAGEQFDTNAQMYYNRARYYDQNTGRFNRSDPFAGSPQDPQSLHKYAYAHANPINGIDPSGKNFSVGNLVTVIGVIAIIALVGIAINRLGLMMAPRGDTIYLDFSGFDLSGVSLENGVNPDEEFIKIRIIQKMNEAFKKASVKAKSGISGSRNNNARFLGTENPRRSKGGLLHGKVL